MQYYSFLNIITQILLLITTESYRKRRQGHWVKSHPQTYQVPIFLSLQMLELCKFQMKFFCTRGKNINNSNLIPQGNFKINAICHTLITMFSVSGMYNNSTFSPRPVSPVQTNIKAKCTSTNFYEKLSTWCKPYNSALTHVLKMVLFTWVSLFSSLLQTGDNNIAHFLKLYSCIIYVSYLMVMFKAQNI